MKKGLLFIGLIGMVGIIVSFLAGYGVRNYSQSAAEIQNVAQGLASPTVGLSAVSSSQTSSTSTSSSSVSSSLPGFLNTSSTPSSTFEEYKILQNVDPCTLNKLGLQSWKLFQVGSVITVPGYDIDCKIYNAAISGIDWAVLQRP